MWPVQQCASGRKIFQKVQHGEGSEKVNKARKNEASLLESFHSTGQKLVRPARSWLRPICGKDASSLSHGHSVPQYQPAALHNEADKSLCILISARQVARTMFAQHSDMPACETAAGPVCRSCSLQLLSNREPLPWVFLSHKRSPMSKYHTGRNFLKHNIRLYFKWRQGT